jgi:hypothetical protein
VRARQSTHYYGMKEAFLRSYHKICPAEFEGQVIHHPGARGSYFLVCNGTKRAIPSLDKMKVPMETTHFITDVDNFNAIPVGEPLPAVVP